MPKTALLSEEREVQIHKNEKPVTTKRTKNVACEKKPTRQI
jgi:hypothetical protein